MCYRCRALLPLEAGCGGMHGRCRFTWWIWRADLPVTLSFAPFLPGSSGGSGMEPFLYLSTLLPVTQSSECSEWTLCSSKLVGEMFISGAFRLQGWLSQHRVLAADVVVQSSVLSDSLRPHGLPHTRLLCPPLSPRVCSNPYPLSLWCHWSTIASCISFNSHTNPVDCWQLSFCRGGTSAEWVDERVAGWRNQHSNSDLISMPTVIFLCSGTGIGKFQFSRGWILPGTCYHRAQELKKCSPFLIGEKSKEE